MENVGEKIYKLRKEKGISQEKLAEKLNVMRPTISRWENNAVTPNIENIENLCAFFGVEINYFLSDEEIVALKEKFVEEVVTETQESICAKSCAVNPKDKNEGKFNTLKIVSMVAGMVLLGLFVIASGVAAYVSIAPTQKGQYVDTVESINFTGIIFLVVGIVAAAIFITLLTIFISRYVKKRKNK